MEKVNLELVAELEIYELSDRMTMAGLLVKNGYTVGIGRVRRQTGKSYAYTLRVYKGETQNGN